MGCEPNGTHVSLVPGPGWTGPARHGGDGQPRGMPMRRLPGRLRPRGRPRYKGPSFNRMVPNILTLLGLCAGLTGMRFALDGRFGAGGGGDRAWPARSTGWTGGSRGC